MHEPRRPTSEAPTEAAALGYRSGVDGAPRLLAHGRGAVADRLLELAAEADVPITKDPTLVSVLGALDVGAEVPPDLFGVIAEVLAWAYRVDRAAGEAGPGARAA